MVKILKSTGIVRRVDDLGRIVIPMEIRKIFNIDQRDGNNIVLRKYEPQCIFCGQAGDVKVFKNRNVCQDCLKELSNK